MKLRRLRILGFQAFHDSGDIHFSDGVNLIVGQNNSGKSSLLRSMYPFIPDDRHRTAEAWNQSSLPMPKVELDIEMTGLEFRDAVLRRGRCAIPVPPGKDITRYGRRFIDRQNHLFRLSSISGYAHFVSDYPSTGEFAGDQSQQRNSCIAFAQNGSIAMQASSLSVDDDIPACVHESWKNCMFFFNAERMSIGESEYHFATRLSPDAKNLPAILFHLQGSYPTAFDKLNSHLRDIFPSVGHVRAGPKSDTHIEVRVWPTTNQTRPELSVPLNFSGTGISQVLSLLTAILTIEDGIFLIDEINSFLHPAAVKSLIKIINSEYSRNQYIVSTHSPDVISSFMPTKLYLIYRKSFESFVKNIDISSLDNLKEISDHLGVSISDVFAADRVIWVEGATEEICFPFILSLRGGFSLPSGTIFSSVLATSDFTRRRREREIVYEIYSRLSAVTGPIVQSVRFSFDSEELNDEEKEKMIRESHDRLRFLPRRHLECYLIDPSAIAWFLNDRIPSNEFEFSAAQVAEELSNLAASTSFNRGHWKGDLNDVVWLRTVDAARLIKQTVLNVSSGRLDFRKKYDSLDVLKYISQHNRENLDKLVEYVYNLVC